MLILIQFDYVFYVIDLKIIVTFQINSSAVNETRHWCQPAQRNHCQGHLRPAVVAAQTLQTKSCVPGEDHKGKYWRATAANKRLKYKKKCIFWHRIMCVIYSLTSAIKFSISTSKKIKPFTYRMTQRPSIY